MARAAIEDPLIPFFSDAARLSPSAGIRLPRQCPPVVEAAVHALERAVHDVQRRDDDAALATYLRNQAAACLEAWNEGELADANAADVLRTLAALVNAPRAKTLSVNDAR